MHPKHMLAPIAMLSALCLTACGSGPAPLPRVEVQRLTVPPALLSCQPQPDPPTMVDDRALALYILALADAGDDCRDRLGRVRGLVEWDQKK